MSILSRKCDLFEWTHNSIINRGWRKWKQSKLFKDTHTNFSFKIASRLFSHFPARRKCQEISSIQFIFHFFKKAVKNTNTNYSYKCLRSLLISLPISIASSSKKKIWKMKKRTWIACQKVWHSLRISCSQLEFSLYSDFPFMITNSNTAVN